MPIPALKKRSVVLLSIAAAVLAAPAAAEADTFCVGDPTCAGIVKPGTAAGLQAALDDAETNGEGDVVRIGAGTYTAPTAFGFHYFDVGDELDIQGKSAQQTVIKGNGELSADALGVTAGGPESTISDLTIRKNGSGNSFGLVLSNASAAGVAIDESAGATGAGLLLKENGNFIGGTIEALDDRGVVVPDGGAHKIATSTIEGIFAIEHEAGALEVTRTRIDAERNGISTSGTAVTTASQTLIESSDPVGLGLYVFNGGTLHGERLTIGGHGANHGVLVSQYTAGLASVANLHNSTVTGFSSELTAGAATGTSTINVDHSNYDVVTESSGGQVNEGAGNVNVTPAFVDSTFADLDGYDYRLRHDSPLIDAGAAGGGAGTDLDNNQRLVDGDGAGGAVRDMGAFEYQRRAPTAAASGPPTGVQGMPLAFTGTGSADPDPGDVLTYTWAFGDGTTATGKDVTHAYSSAGARTVTLTVTDSSGRTDTASVPVVISALPAQQAGPGTPGAPATPAGQGAAASDRVAPVLRSASLARKVFRARGGAKSRSTRRSARTGTAFRFTLSERATVRVSLERLTKGKKARRKPAGALTPTVLAAGSRKLAFSGRVGRRALKPGRYRATLRAVDAAGNRSKPIRLSFRVAG